MVLVRTDGYVHRNAAGHFTPTTLGPQAVKNLIEKRNARFIIAINEWVSAQLSPRRYVELGHRLINACKTTGEDPVQMLRKAANDHIPVNPSSQAASTSNVLTAPGVVPDAESRPSVETIIAEIESQESYKSQILFRRVFDVRPARWGTLDRVLPEPITQALQDARNVTRFYTHQAHAINSFWRGRNVIVSTATASGKSIIYQVRNPFVSSTHKDPQRAGA